MSSVTKRYATTRSKDRGAGVMPTLPAPPALKRLGSPPDAGALPHQVGVVASPACGPAFARNGHLTTAPRDAESPGAASGRPPGVPTVSLYERRKAGYPLAVWTGLIVSVALHWAAFGLSPTIVRPIASSEAPELTAIELPPEVEIPAAPKSIPRPATPVAVSSDVELLDDITIAPTTFTAEPPPAALPRPVIEEADEEVWSEPTFTPYTTPPMLINREEAARAIAENYPENLREAGMGGTVLMWFLIDETGKVLNTKLVRSSALPELDRAAENVAGVLAFKPALNRDKPARVWVQLPIIFQVVPR